MKKNKRRLFTLVLTGIALISEAQDTIVNNTLSYDSHLHKLIPDKVFEFGVPLLFIFVLLNTIVTILKNRADNQLKIKMIEKGISEETLVQVFKEQNILQKLQPLKYFLICAALAISFIVIHFCKDYLVNQSGYLALGIILLFSSLAFFTYYRILQQKL